MIHARVHASRIDRSINEFSRSLFIASLFYTSFPYKICLFFPLPLSKLLHRRRALLGCTVEHQAERHQRQHQCADNHAEADNRVNQRTSKKRQNFRFITSAFRCRGKHASTLKSIHVSRREIETTQRAQGLNDAFRFTVLRTRGTHGRR